MKEEEDLDGKEESYIWEDLQIFKKTMEDKNEKEEKVTDGKEEETHFYLLVLP